MWIRVQSQLYLSRPGPSLRVLGSQCYAENVVDPGQWCEVESLVVDSGPQLRIWV